VDDQSRSRRFERLAVPHLDSAYELARWITGNPHDAEDVVQDAYLRAFRFFDAWRGDSARAWLLAIVRNAAYRWLARNRPKHVFAVEPEVLAAAGERAAARGDVAGASPEDDVVAESERGRLRRLLDRLPPQFREILVLRELQGLSYREIAEVAAVPEGTVMSRLARARAELRRLWFKDAP
jgi:RNA polymerase sigma-70 factor (ECF subfamily)